MAANAATILPAAPIIAPPVPIIVPPAYETTRAIATKTICELSSLHPCLNHSNMWALEQDLFDKLQAIQSARSDEWGYQGLAKQPAE